MGVLIIFSVIIQTSFNLIMSNTLILNTYWSTLMYPAKCWNVIICVCRRIWYLQQWSTGSRYYRCDTQVDLSDCSGMHTPLINPLVKSVSRSFGLQLPLNRISLSLKLRSAASFKCDVMCCELWQMNSDGFWFALLDWIWIHTHFY